MAGELTSVADDEAVVHLDGEVRVYDGLRPDTDYTYDGHEFRTFPDLGERLATVATVNDVHFGETVCGVLEGYDGGPTFQAEPGEDPYPDVMNRAVIADIAGRRARRRRGQGRPHHPRDPGGVRRLPGPLRHGVRRPPAPRAREPRRLRG